MTQLLKFSLIFISFVFSQYTIAYSNLSSEDILSRVLVNLSIQNQDEIILQPHILLSSYNYFEIENNPLLQSISSQCKIEYVPIKAFSYITKSNHLFLLDKSPEKALFNDKALVVQNDMTVNNSSVDYIQNITKGSILLPLSFMENYKNYYVSVLCAKNKKRFLAFLNLTSEFKNTFYYLDPNSTEASQLSTVKLQNLFSILDVKRNLEKNTQIHLNTADISVDAHGLMQIPQLFSMFNLAQDTWLKPNAYCALNQLEQKWKAVCKDTNCSLEVNALKDFQSYKSLGSCLSFSKFKSTAKNKNLIQLLKKMGAYQVKSLAKSSNAIQICFPEPQRLRDMSLDPTEAELQLENETIINYCN